jgi:RNA-directed DNA polymerase
MAPKHMGAWVLEGDIKSCFDRISHEWLIAHIPMDKSILRKWLKAGYMEKDILYPSEEGTPQGGIITLPTIVQKQ